MTATADRSSFGELVDRARETPMTRDGVRALATRLEDLDVDGAIDEALARRDWSAAAALTLASGARGRLVSSERIARLLPDLEDPRHLPALVACCDGDRLELLLDLVESGRMHPARDALALFLASQLLEGNEAPARLVTLLRLRSRQRLSVEAAFLIGSAALEVSDPGLEAVAGEWIALARSPSAQKVKERVRRELLQPVLETLPLVAERRAVRGFTARRPVPKIGRNDPCHCGSGRKYKKCCAEKDGARAADPSPVGGLTMKEYEEQIHLHVDGRDFYYLEPSVLARLDFEGLSTSQLIATVRRLSDCRRWDDAERAMAVLSKRHDLPGDARPDEFREELIDAACTAAAWNVVARQVALTDEESPIRERMRLPLALARPPDEARALLEKLALAGLGADHDALYDVAYRLLDTSGALGILVARGCLRADRALDSETLLIEIERCRDRLGLPPNDVASEMFDRLLEADVAEAIETDESGGAKRRREEVAEIEALQQRAKDAAAKVVRLERRLRDRQAELDSMTAGSTEPRAPAQGETPPSDDEERRLRQQAKELKGLIAEGNAERANLRKLIAQLTEQLRTRPAGDAGADGGDGPSDERCDEDGPEEERPGRLLVPRFAPRAELALGALPRRVAADALRLSGELAAGDEHAWAKVKRVRRLEKVCSTRLGIHHRMLFRHDGGSLELLDVVQRKDLEAAIERLA